MSPQAPLNSPKNTSFSELLATQNHIFWKCGDGQNKQLTSAIISLNVHFAENKLASQKMTKEHHAWHCLKVIIDEMSLTYKVGATRTQATPKTMNTLDHQANMQSSFYKYENHDRWIWQLFLIQNQNQMEGENREKLRSMNYVC